MSHDQAVPEAVARLARVRERMARAAGRAGRDPAGISLIAVSKTMPAERVLDMASAGQRVFGENKVQEAQGKIPRVNADWGREGGEPLVWHGIGHLQRNKVRAAIEVFDRIDSVDSVRLAEALHAEGDRLDRKVPALVQFNCSAEGSKGGFEPGDVDTIGARLRDLDRLDIRGLMTIARFSDDPEAARGDFTRLRLLRDRLQEAWGRELPVLSMGMSHDLDVAVEEGATEVRVGTALFGARPSPGGA